MTEAKMSEQTNDRKHVFLVDGSGFIFRAFHALPPMNRDDGTPTNAVFGFTNMLIKLIEDLKADHCAIIFDTARKTFRNDVYKEYKANRPPPPDELVPQFAIIREAVLAFNIACIELEGYEADDLIATYTRLAREQGADVTIVSSDKDLMQLVGPNIKMFDPMKSKDIGAEDVIEKFGVGPQHVIDVQALAGDTSDNVPGVPGVGIKTAAQLITQYGNLETLLERASEIKQPKRRDNLINYAEMARLSKTLVTLKRDVDVPQPLSDLILEKPNPLKVLEFLRAQGFKRLIARFEAELKQESGDTLPVSSYIDIAKKQYELVDNLKSLIDWAAIVERNGLVAFDTETDSLNASQANLIGISLAISDGRACYIPLRHEAGADQVELLGKANLELKQIEFEAAIEIIRPILEDPSILKIGHNIKFDALVMKQPHNGGINLASVDDTMCLSYVMNAGLHGHGLDELSLLHFDHTNIKYNEVCGTGKTK
ncbi:MAG: 5'-3' exonuclease H3TH domain-containing protein, partial [Pseudomonadota bacterium]|nr:5'-3' exonuclease H3TH domain-containing protein [Pseudomonadota bacterium]